MALYHPEARVLIGTQAKCGSTSLEKLLLRQPGWTYVLPKHLPPDPREWLELTDHRLMQVRHPMSRFWSIYRWNVKRNPHEALSHLVHRPDEFVAEFLRRWRANRWSSYTATQAEYAERFQMTGFQKLEDGGLPPLLQELGLTITKPLPRLNVNRNQIELPGLDVTQLRPWLEEDEQRFGYR